MPPSGVSPTQSRLCCCLLTHESSAIYPLSTGGAGLDRRQGAYDLTVLEKMSDAFPPKRTSNNIYRENRHAENGAGGGRSGRDKGPMDFGETRDSLDRLAGSTGDRRRLSR